MKHNRYLIATELGRLVYRIYPADMPRTQSLEEKLKAVRARFVERCQAETHQVADLAARLAFDERASVALVNLSHRLRGAAASFGFHEVAERAREVEETGAGESDVLRRRAVALATALSEVSA